MGTSPGRETARGSDAARVGAAPAARPSPAPGRSAPGVPSAAPPTVRLLLFAVYRDLVGGRGEIEVELPPGADVAAALRAARARHPSLSRLPERPAVAVNQVYADLDTPLGPGDEVALLPPVAGG